MNSAIKISPELREALQAYLDWVNEGAPDFEPFHRADGLCFNICNEYSMDVAYELGELFITMGLDEDYPFGEWDYQQNCRTRTHHIHTQRIEWIKTVLETTDE